MKATIVFTDTDAGPVNIAIEFDPPITDDTASDAQKMATLALELLAHKLSEPTDG